ncbi:MAG: ATP-binding protein, partial [Thermodesulfovibrionales bacterium]|nr:ATP-binding protein [Thermodesulfovibrionales bacterium]
MANLNTDEEFRKKLLKTFKTEAEGHIKSIIEGLLEIEKTDFKGDYTPIIDRIFRNAHSLKGSSRTVNLLSIEEICQEMEGLFHLVKKGELTFNEDMIETLLKTCSILESIINNPGLNVPSKQIADSIRKLKDRSYEPIKTKPASIKPTRVETVTTEDMKFKQSSSDILKIESSKFEFLLSETEEIVSIKGYLNNNLKVLNELDIRINELLTNTKKSFFNNTDNLVKSVQSLTDEIRDISSQISRHKKQLQQGKFFLERKVDNILLDLREIVMMPLSTLLESFPIMIRELSKAQNKEVEFVTDGKELQLDRRILDELRDPLTHIFRNAIDHGIETIEERQIFKKNPKAMIKFIANFESGGEIVLKVMDDGKGIDLDLLKEKVLKKGLINNDDLSNMKEEDIINFIFEPEVSTAKIVTNISGRGLGMTIVRESIERLGGTVRVVTERGKGTVFIIRLPVNVSTLKIITMRAYNGVVFGIPTRNISYSSRVKTSNLKTIEGIDTVDIKGSLVSMMKLDDAIDIINTKT